MFMKLIFFILLFPLCCSAQFSISGRVLNQPDKKPVADASVFLSNSSVGAKTANDGTFILSNVKSGKYQLIISIIGFETYSQTITVNDSKMALGDIEILPKLLILNEVTVKATRITDVNRQKYLSWFKDEFLGKSNLALDCKIVNPEILYLHFDEEQNILTASSSDFLLIENPGLGYKIKYLLKHFSLNLSDRSAIRVQFEGSVLFENMTGTVSKEQRWQKRRLDVYQNSSMHFLRAALNDQIENEGFTAFQLDVTPNPQRPPDSIINAKTSFFEIFKNRNNNYQDSLSFWKKKAALPKMIKNNNVKIFSKDDIIKPTNEKGIYALFSGNNNGSIQVTYNKYHQRMSDESTRLDFRKKSVLFDNNGVIIDPDGLSITGAWSRNRVAELLPVDYEPPSQTVNDVGSDIHQSTAQRLSAPLKADLLKITAASDSLNKILPFEKIYLQFDKPYYAIGDTIWFKAYLLNSALQASGKSGILNIDMLSDSGKIVKQYRLPVQNGLSWGNLFLDDKDFTLGTCTLRAYTNWMRNFGDAYFYYQTIAVSGPNENTLLVNTLYNATSPNGNTTVNARLLFSTINQTPYAIEPLSLQLIANGKHLNSQKVQTGVDGALDVNFAIPQKATNMALIAENRQKNKKAIIPIILNRPANADVQFLPEGGSLVAGLPANIGFKAVGEDGKGLNVTGTVFNSAQQQVAAFKSIHNGMGCFGLTVVAGENYTAKVTLADGSTKEYPILQSKITGTVIQIKNPSEADSVEVTVATTNDVVQSGESFFLIAKARSVVCYAAIISFRDGNIVKRKIAKSLFPSGIARFTLMTTKYQPLNERLIFIDHNDNLNIKVITAKPFYGKRDSVGIKLKVTDQNGGAVTGNFSVAVTDNATVKPDSVNGKNIVNHILLTSCLKGYVETPAWYFSSKSAEKWQALDNLLLTQGWTAYDWQQILNPQPITFEAETEFMVKGHVFNLFNKPVKASHVLLFSKSPAMLLDTVTNDNGSFVFDHLPQIDTPIFTLKAVNKNGKSFNVGITVDEIKPPDFIKPSAPALMPWYVNSDTTLLNYTKTKALLIQQNYRAGGHLLKEVKITAKKIIKDSQNLNGPGDADLVLDEKDMEKAGKKTLLQLLEENVKGFGESIFAQGGFKAMQDSFLMAYVAEHKTMQWYFVNRKPVKFIFDGVSLAQVISSPEDPVFFLTIKDYLSGHSAEDVKGIEVIHSPGYAAAYLTRFAPDHLLIDAIYHNPPVNIAPSDIAIVEITTRGGHGPLIDYTPGMYLYKPLPISEPKQFYKLKYAIRDTANHDMDLRSTIDWEPNIITDKNGEATFSFYTADKPSTYFIIINGADMNGNLGFKTAKIKVVVNNGAGK